MARAGGVVFPHLASGDHGVGMHAQSDAWDDTYWSDTTATHGNTITLAVWLRFIRDPGTPYLVFSKRADWSSTDGFGLWSGYNGTDWVFSVNSTRAGMVSGTAVAGNTYHLVGTYDQQNVKLYINGVLNGSTALTAAIGTNASVLRFGMLKVSEMIAYAAQTWPRALTDAEVRSLYDPATRWSMYAPLVHRQYFDLVGGGGTTYNESPSFAAVSSLPLSTSATSTDAIGLAATAAMSQAGAATAAASVSLVAATAAVMAAAATASSGLSVAAATALTQGAAATGSVASSFASTAAVGQAGAASSAAAAGFVSAATQSYAVACLASLAVAIAAHPALDMSDGSTQNVSEAIGFAGHPTHAVTAAAIAAAVQSFVAGCGLSQANAATAGAALGLSAAAAFAPVPGAASSASIVLAAAAALSLSAGASGDVTYTVLAAAAETLRAALAEGDTLRAAGVQAEDWRN